MHASICTMQFTRYVIFYLVIVTNTMYNTWPVCLFNYIYLTIVQLQAVATSKGVKRGSIPLERKAKFSKASSDSEDEVEMLQFSSKFVHCKFSILAVIGSLSLYTSVILAVPMCCC